MPQTYTIKNTNEVMPTLALTTAEDTITISTGIPSDRPADRTRAQIVLQSDSAWLYSHKTGGPYFLVGPYQPLVLDGVGIGQVLFVKAVAGTPTMYGMVGK